MQLTMEMLMSHDKHCQFGIGTQVILVRPHHSDTHVGILGDSLGTVVGKEHPFIMVEFTNKHDKVVVQPVYPEQIKKF